jgi:DNA-binding beta-propeller fold protein YncE
LKAKRTIDVIAVSRHVQRISMSTDGRWVFTQDQTAPRIAVIDTETNKVSKWIDLPQVVYASTPTPDGKHLLAVSPTGKLFSIDVAAMKLDNTFDIPDGGNVVLVTPDNQLGYISCRTTGKIAVLDLATWKMKDTMTLTPGVDGMAWISGN